MCNIVEGPCVPFTELKRSDIDYDMLLFLTYLDSNDTPHGMFKAVDYSEPDPLFNVRLGLNTHDYVNIDVSIF